MQAQGCHLPLTWRAHFEVLLFCQDRIKEVGAPASPSSPGRTTTKGLCPGFLLLSRWEVL